MRLSTNNPETQSDSKSVDALPESNPIILQTDYSQRLFQQYSTVNLVPCLFLKWLKEDDVPFRFDQIEGNIRTKEKKVNPDMIASHKTLRHGLVIEIKAERTDQYIQNEGDKLRRQLEQYTESFYSWPDLTEGAKSNKETIDVIFVCHSINIETYVKEIEKSKRLSESMKGNFAILGWEMVPNRSGEILQIRHRAGSCKEALVLDKFRRFNGYGDNVIHLGQIANDYSVRLKIQEMEPLLILLVQRSFTLPYATYSLPKEMNYEPTPAYIDKERIYFLPDAMLRSINSEDDIDKKRYMARIEKRRFNEALDLLAKLGLFKKEDKSDRYSIAVAERQKELNESVLKPFARHLVEQKKTTTTFEPQPDPFQSELFPA
jgi:hypothetical protein